MGQVLEGMCKENSGRLFRRRASKCLVDIVAPKLHPHGPNGGVGDRVGDSSNIYIECANGKVGVSGNRRDKRLKGIGRRVVLSMETLLACCESAAVSLTY